MDYCSFPQVSFLKKFYFRFFTFYFLILTFCFSSFSQNTTNSPYSNFGLGDIEPNTLASFSAMGQTKYASALPYSINISNPASYGWLLLPTFDVGFTSNFLTISYNDSVQRTNNTYFKNMALAFPVSKRWWTFSFGLVPYSKMGYRLSSAEKVENYGTVNYSYTGSGGTNRFFIGNALNLLKDSTQQFSVGINASYLWGAMAKTSRSVPEASLLSFNTRMQNNTSVSGFLFEGGLLYSKKINKLWNISAGVDYETDLNQVKAERTFLAESYTGEGLSEEVRDTIAFYSAEEKIGIPQKFGAGIHVLYNSRWLVAFDYSQQHWPNLRYFGEGVALAGFQQFSLGGQYSYNAKERESFLKTLSYRAGFRYANTPVMVNKRQLNEYGISAGIGMPIGEKSRSSFNISVETGSRGENRNGLAQERFTHVFFGFSFTPSFYDRWFVRPKID